MFFLLRTELEAAVSEGYTVFGLSAPGTWVSELEGLGIHHVPISNLTRAWKPQADLRAALELRRKLRALDLDVLHTHTPKAGVIGRVVGRICGVPIIANTCHGLPYTNLDPKKKRLAIKLIEALAAQFSDIEFFLNSEDMYTMRRFTRRKNPMLMGNGTDLDRFTF
ncbi:MAG TPA: glycosyltransferase, partial [Acidimicrobiales bacterium]|nr:glycosyltransferase [Acidimicrobiales bacterium]